MIEHRLEVSISASLTASPTRASIRETMLVEPAAPGGRAGRTCDPIGYALEPTCNGLTAPDGTGIANQRQECGLKRVLDIMGVVQYATTGPHDHSCMALHKRGECQLGPLASLFDEPLQELRVRQASQGP